MRRFFKILIFTIATIVFMAAGYCYGQDSIVPIPNPNWPLDSVVNGSVHFYTVPGDTHYDEPSAFVWTCVGGRLFSDPDTLNLAGTGAEATLLGDDNNMTKMWVVWDVFDVPRDTGYIYVYEISNPNGCQRSSKDAGKFQGMRIIVTAPPKARFINREAIVCSDFDSARVILEIEGMPPYDLVYSVNGEIKNWHIEQSDLVDYDHDKKVNNVSFFYSGLSKAVFDTVYTYNLISVSSGGVKGTILDYSTTYLIVHVQPPAPVIRNEWTEATIGSTHTYHLDNAGVNPEEWFWNIRDMATNLVNNYNSKTESDVTITFTSPPGKYYLEAQYRDKLYGCYSPFDSLNIELFDLPTIAFSDTDTIMNCSATSLKSDEQFDFVVEYKGALTFGFTYEVYDYNGKLVDGGKFDNLTNRSNTISIKNNFINDALPEKIRPWKVVIKTAHNEEPDINVNILDSDKPGGRDERVIMIYPKPIILDDIDFAN